MGPRRKKKLNKKSDHSFSTHIKFPEKLTFLPPDLHTYVAYQWVKNVSFYEKLEYVANE